MTLLVMKPTALLNILERAFAGEDVEVIMLEVLDQAIENNIKLEEK